MNLAEAYKRLGLSGNEDISQVKEAYKDLAQMLHPDKFAQSSVKRQRAEEQFKQIKEAYEYILENESKDRRKASSNTQQHHASPNSSEKHAIEDALEACETQSKYTVLVLVVTLIIGALVRHPLFISIAACVIVSCLVRTLKLFQQQRILHAQYQTIVSREAK